MTHHLVGVGEIAEMLGVSRQRVAQLIESYDDFPAPEVELTAGRIWSRTAIETWIVTHPERGPGRPERRSRRGGMFTRFTDRGRSAIAKAQEEARLLGHNYIGTEHLLLGLLAIGEGLAHDVLVSRHVTLADVRRKVREIVGEGPEATRGHIPFTPRAKKVLELALREGIQLGHNYIGTEHMLLALIREGEGVGWQALAQLGLKPKAARKAVLDTMSGVGIPTVEAAAESVDLARRILELEERIRRLEED